jgi:hypothetical protein
MNARYDIPAQPPPPAQNGFVRLVKCTTSPEADQVVKELKNAGIAADIENKMDALTNSFSDLRNDYPFIQIRISGRDYEAARKVLMRNPRLAESKTAPPSE